MNGLVFSSPTSTTKREQYRHIRTSCLGSLFISIHRVARSYSGGPYCILQFCQESIAIMLSRSSAQFQAIQCSQPARYTRPRRNPCRIHPRSNTPNSKIQGIAQKVVMSHSIR
jgi:hypothetical protein